MVAIKDGSMRLYSEEKKKGRLMTKKMTKKMTKTMTMAMMTTCMENMKTLKKMKTKTK